MNDYIFFTREKDFKRYFNKLKIKAILGNLCFMMMFPFGLKKRFNAIFRVAKLNADFVNGICVFPSKDIMINCESLKSQKNIIKTLIHEDLHKAMNDYNVNIDSEGLVDKLTKHSITN